MAQRFTTEIFYRPDEHHRESVTVPAAIYNQCRLLLAGSPTGYIFVPIRSMQYLAVIGNKEILFVDSQAYAVKDGEGGRLVTLAWQTQQTGQRSSLDEPVPIEVVYYRPGIETIQSRLIGEFSQAMETLRQREADRTALGQQARVLPFRS